MPTTMTKMHFDGWEFPPPGVYSGVFRDLHGFLRVKGLLLKKGGSRASMPTQKLVPHRRNWSERWFFMDVDTATLRYYVDEECTREAGVVRFVPNKTEIRVPTEVRLRGRHAPASSDATNVNYLELAGTCDADGNERLDPFAVRAKTTHEFEEWLRTFAYCVKSLGGAGTIVVDEAAVLEDSPRDSVDNAARPGRASDADSRRADADAGPFETFDEEGDDALACDAVSKKRDDDDDDSNNNIKKKTQPKTGALSQADVARDTYYYHDLVSGDALGPVGLADLKDRWKRGRLEPGSFVFPTGLDDWVTIESVPTLLRLLSPPKPPSREPALLAPATRPPPPRFAA